MSISGAMTNLLGGLGNTLPANPSPAKDSSNSIKNGIEGIENIFKKKDHPDVDNFVKVHRNADQNKDGSVTKKELNEYKTKLQMELLDLQYQLQIQGSKNPLGAIQNQLKMAELEKELKTVGTMSEHFGVFDKDKSKGITPQEIYDVAAKDGKPYSVSPFDLIDLKGIFGKIFGETRKESPAHPTPLPRPNPFPHPLFPLDPNFDPEALNPPTV